jgi:HNH endonuclease
MVPTFKNSSMCLSSTDVERVLSKYLYGDGCWEWLGKRSGGIGGYGGYQTLEKANVSAHRMMYELFVGPVPMDMELDHLCRNRGCGRPDHMEVVTRAENARRGVIARKERRGLA